jgi:hypothetical protein
MLTDGYKRWVTSNEQGDFPQEFNEGYGGDWDVLKEIAPGGSEYIAALGEDAVLPKVVFRSLIPGMASKEG